jgi:hypothetical protein
LLNFFIEKVVFKLIQKNIKDLSKIKGFSNRFNFNHEKIKVLSIGKGLAMKIWEFCQEV